MARKIRKNSAVYKAQFVLKNLKLELTDGIKTEGYTLEYKTIKMAGLNYKFIEVFLNGKSLGHVDPYTILFFCNTSNFIDMHPNAFRERIGDILHINPPEELYITKNLLEKMISFRLLRGYGSYSNTYEQFEFELSSGDLDLMEEKLKIEE